MTELVTPSLPRWKSLLPAALIAGSTVVLYLPAIDGQFVFDDPFYVQRNEHLRKPLGEFLAWTTTGMHQANWHPLTWCSHAADLALFGENPAGHHAVSIALHAINAALLLLLLVRLTNRLAPSIAVAVIFAFHPLQVESVAWISERKNLLCMFFLLLCGHAYACYVKKITGWRYLAVLSAFAAALMSKPMAVTWPFVLLLLDAWPLRRFSRRAVVEKLPMLALTVGAAWIAVHTQQSARAVTSLDIIGWSARLQNVAVSYVRYLGKIFAPLELSPFYPYPGMEAKPWTIGEAVLCLTLLLGVTTLVLVSARRRPFLAVGWFIFLGTLVPVIGLVQIGRQAMADRFAYLPMIGVLVAVAWLAADLLGAHPEGAPAADTTPRRPSGRSALVGAILLAAALWPLAKVTRAQIPVWHDNETMWRHVYRLEPQSPNAMHALARVLLARKTPESDREARRLLETAIPLERDLFQNTLMRRELAEVLLRTELYTLAIMQLEDVVKQAPEDAAARGFLAYVQDRAAFHPSGESRRQALIESARQNYLFALGLQAPPAEKAEIHGHYAAFLDRIGQTQDAVAEFRRALSLYPTPRLRTALDAIERRLRSGTAAENPKPQP